MGRERRRFDRLEVSIPAILKRGGLHYPLVTGDVSRHGAFIRTDDPCPERDLVQVTFELPGAAIDVMCMVTRAVFPAKAGPQGPGMGLDFFALSSEAKDLWDRWVLGALRHPGEAGLSDDTLEDLPLITGELVRAAPPPTLEAPLPELPNAPVRREHPRHQACFMVRMKDRAALDHFATRDISEGGMFLETPLKKSVGDQVTLVLIHPETEDQFSLPGTVTRVEATPEGQRGLGVRFAPLDEAQQSKLEDFIDTGIETLDILEDPRKARVALLEAQVRQEPGDASLLEELGDAQLEAGDVAGAVEALSQAMVLSPSMPGIHRLLSDAYTLLGDDRRARAHQRVAICLKKYAGDLLTEELQRADKPN